LVVVADTRGDTGEMSTRCWTTQLTVKISSTGTKRDRDRGSFRGMRRLKQERLRLMRERHAAELQERAARHNQPVD